MVSVVGVFEEQAIPLLAEEARNGAPLRIIRPTRAREHASGPLAQSATGQPEVAKTTPVDLRFDS